MKSLRELEEHIAELKNLSTALEKQCSNLKTSGVCDYSTLKTLLVRIRKDAIVPAEEIYSGTIKLVSLSKLNDAEDQLRKKQMTAAEVLDLFKVLLSLLTVLTSAYSEYLQSLMDDFLDGKTIILK